MSFGTSHHSFGQAIIPGNLVFLRNLRNPKKDLEKYLATSEGNTATLL